MNLIRRSLLLALGALATAGALAQGAYPNQPVKIIVPFPPAGATDLVTRLVAGKVAADSGWNFVIDNRPGASGNIDAAATPLVSSARGSPARSLPAPPA